MDISIKEFDWSEKKFFGWSRPLSNILSIEIRYQNTSLSKLFYCGKLKITAVQNICTHIWLIIFLKHFFLLYYFSFDFFFLFLIEIISIIVSTSSAEVEECIKLQSLFLNKSQLIITPLELRSLNLDKVLTQLTLSKSIY